MPRHHVYKWLFGLYARGLPGRFRDLTIRLKKLLKLLPSDCFTLLFYANKIIHIFSPYFHSYPFLFTKLVLLLRQLIGLIWSD